MGITAPPPTGSSWFCWMSARYTVASPIPRFCVYRRAKAVTSPGSRVRPEARNSSRSCSPLLSSVASWPMDPGHPTQPWLSRQGAPRRGMTLRTTCERSTQRGRPTRSGSLPTDLPVRSSRCGRRSLPWLAGPAARGLVRSDAGIEVHWGKVSQLRLGELDSDAAADVDDRADRDGHGPLAP